LLRDRRLPERLCCPTDSIPLLQGVEGQAHDVDAKVLAPILVKFFK
jgi:hypothetical protein